MFTGFRNVTLTKTGFEPAPFESSKIDLWKNVFHSTEHSLVAYITTSEVNKPRLHCTTHLLRRNCLNSHQDIVLDCIPAVLPSRIENAEGYRKACVKNRVQPIDCREFRGDQAPQHSKSTQDHPDGHHLGWNLHHIRDCRLGS